MTESFYSINETFQTELKEKASRFIAIVQPISSFNDAELKLVKLKKTYWDASHHCYAIVLNNSDKRYSDDGEPNNSAGKPIYDCIIGAKIADVMLVVVRYFGGTKLGIGGLVKAYQESAQLVLKKIILQEKVWVRELNCELEYAQIQDLDYLINFHNIKKVKKDFSEKITYKLFIPLSLIKIIEPELVSRFNGQLKFKLLNDLILL